MQASVDQQSQDIQHKWDLLVQELIKNDVKREELINLSLAMFFEADKDEDGVLTLQEYKSFEGMLVNAICDHHGLSAEDHLFNFDNTAEHLT